jgi:putative intracellular protease/amidase
MDALSITVGVVLFDGYEPLDFVGPISVFGSVPGIKMVSVQALRVQYSDSAHPFVAAGCHHICCVDAGVHG